MSGGKKVSAPLPTFPEQMKAVEAIAKDFKAIMESIELVLPPPGAVLGSDAINNASSTQMRKALDKLKSIFNGLMGIKGGKGKPEAASPIADAAMSYDQMLTALRAYRTAFVAYQEDLANGQSLVSVRQLTARLGKADPKAAADALRVLEDTLTKSEAQAQAEAKAKAQAQQAA